MRSKVGDKLSGQTYTLTQAKVDRYSRYALEGRDTENIHTNLAKAKLAGLPGPVAHGRHPVAFFSEAMLRAFGEAWIASGHLEVTMTRLIVPGETLTLRGEVTRVTAEDGGDRVEVAMALVNQAGESAQSGLASVLVPTGGEERP